MAACSPLSQEALSNSRCAGKCHLSSGPARQLTCGLLDCAVQTHLTLGHCSPFSSQYKSLEPSVYTPTQHAHCCTTPPFTATSIPNPHPASPWPHHMLVWHMPSRGCLENVIRIPFCPRIPMTLTARGNPSACFQGFPARPISLLHPQPPGTTQRSQTPLDLFHFCVAKVSPHLSVSSDAYSKPKPTCLSREAYNCPKGSHFSLELIPWSQQESEQEPGNPRAE